MRCIAYFAAKRSHAGGGAMIKQASRLLIAGTGSGCGKTTAVCAILQALKNRKYAVASFKCGPDYIDPMFHSEILGAKSTNIDLFFSDEAQAKALFMKHSGELNLIEGVMGYYDGMRMDSDQASGYHVAKTLDAPVVLMVNARGMALSAAAVVKGFLEMRHPSGVAGVIFNLISPMTYRLLKDTVEKECGVRVFGYLPPMPECALESRHLGLVTAQEVDNLREKMQMLASQAEQSIDLDALIALMQAQAPIEAEDMRAESVGSVRVAVARDRAFCFYYRDNLEMLEEMGAELVYFSPLTDETLPQCDGLILGGGYPELYLHALSANRGMREAIRAAVRGGLPTIAECGGFMYLTEAIGEQEMVGAIPTRCFNAGKLCRFGYTIVQSQQNTLLLNAGESIRAHEFHYWDAEMSGDAYQSRKPSGKSWSCAYATPTLYAGYPHLYLPSNPQAARRFICKCLEKKCSEKRSHYETDGN